MAVKVNWTLLALEDIENIAEFISKDSFYYATIQIEVFFDKAKILEEYPLSGRVVAEINNELIRELIAGSYRIIYKIVSSNQIDVLTIHHSARLISNNPLFKK